MEKTELSKKKIYIILGIMILVQLGLITYLFYTKKEGFHSDELWSYGYANSYNQKDIFLDEKFEEINKDEWIDSVELKDYIVVKEGEQFSYGSVYSNHIKDLSPPLHSMILHTICSFFPGEFSKTFAYSINAIMFIVSMIFLYKLSEHFFGDKLALVLCFIYGFSQGAFDATIYLRMYGMCVALLMVILYYMVKIVDYSENKVPIKEGLVLFIVSFMAFLTHYYMISVCGILTALLCFYMVCKKQWKKMLIFGITMSLAFVSSVMAFPSLIVNSGNQAKTVSSQAANGNNLDFATRFRTLYSYMSKKVLSIETATYKTNTVQVIIVCAFAILVVLSPLLFLLRNNNKVKRFFARAKEIIMHERLRTLKKILSVNWIILIFMITIILQFIVVGETANVYAMGVCVDRYIVCLYPLFLIFVFYIVKTIVQTIIRNNKAVFGILMLLSIVLVLSQQYRKLRYEDYYFELYREGSAISETVKGKDVLIVMDSKWRLTVLCNALMESNRFYLTDYEMLKKSTKRLSAGLIGEYPENGSFASGYEIVKKSTEKLLTQNANNFYLLINEDDYYCTRMLEDDSFMRKAMKVKDIREYEEVLDIIKSLRDNVKIEKVSTETYMAKRVALYKVSFGE